MKKKPVKKAKPKAPAKPTAKANKPKRKRRTKAQMHADKIAEQAKAAKAVATAEALNSDNKAKAIQDISDMILAGAMKPEIKAAILKTYKITDFHSIYAAAIEYMNNNVFKDNISHYAGYISELEYLYNLAMGRDVKRASDSKDAPIDYKEARSILKQKDEAVLSLNQILQFY